MVFGQMNEPPGARLRVALSALTMAEYFRDTTGADTLLFIDNIFRFSQAGSEVSALLGRMPSAVGYQPTLATEMGAVAGADRLDQQGGHHVGAGRVRAGRRPDRPGPGHRVRPARRVHLPGAVDFGKGHLSGRRSAGLVQPHSRSAVRRRAALRRRPPRADDAAALPRTAGHHRDSRRRRTERRGQAGRASRPPHRAVPVAAVPRGRGRSPASRARSRRWPTRSAASRKSATASGTTCPSRPSCTSARSSRPKSRPRSCKAEGK